MNNSPTFIKNLSTKTWRSIMGDKGGSGKGNAGSGGQRGGGKGSTGGGSGTRGK